MKKLSFRVFAAEAFAEDHVTDLTISCDKPDQETYDAYEGEVSAYLNRHVTISMDYGNPKMLREIAAHITACADWIENGKK